MVWDASMVTPELVLPSGTVTFLFTDIEDSIVLWERGRRVMGGSVARHDEIVGEVVAGYGGYVFTTAGDSFAVAFAGSVDAASAAEETQRRLAAEPWPELAPIRVRIGCRPVRRRSVMGTTSGRR